MKHKLGKGPSRAQNVALDFPEHPEDLQLPVTSEGAAQNFPPELP
jgi:hypothetical protein